MLSRSLAYVLRPFAPGKRHERTNRRMRVEDVVLRWSGRLCLLPQVDEVAVSEFDGEPAILILVSPETTEYRRFIGIPTHIEGISTIVRTRSVVDAGTGS
jgi:hypothetical protein